METLSLMDQLKSFVEHAEKAGNIKKIRETIKYVNSADENDFFLSLDEALEKGLNLAEYKKVVVTINPREELTTILTNEPHILKEDIIVFEKAVKYAKKLVFIHEPESNDLSNLKDQTKSKKKLKK